MQDFPSYILRHYFHSTDWHPSNSYLNLTSHSSSILLDFPIPNGLALSLSSSPTSTFFSTHRLRALPSLGGCAGYVVARTDRPLVFGAQGLSQLLERFRIIHIPKRDDVAGSVEQAATPRDYLLYGCLHAPTARLDALYTTRLSPAWNLIITACSFPPQSPFASNLAPISTQDQQVPAGSPSASQQPPPQMSQGPTSPGATNLQFTLQHDAGKWFNEICYSLDDALWGFRTMHHFGPSTASSSSITAASQSRSVSSSLEDALDIPSAPPQPEVAQSATTASGLVSDLRPSQPSAEVGGGLRGRFSAGAELFFSAAEKSAGLSTGVRFMTLPEGEDDGQGGVYVGDGATGGEAKEWKPPSQPPTTITATLNPMMGHLSTAYASRMGRDIVACSRYDFNVYSYESDLTVGGEYWLRSGTSTSASSSAPSQSPTTEDGERPLYWSSPPKDSSSSSSGRTRSESPMLSLRDDSFLQQVSSQESRLAAVIHPDTGKTSGSKLQGNEAAETADSKPSTSRREALESPNVTRSNSSGPPATQFNSSTASLYGPSSPDPTTHAPPGSSAEDLIPDRTSTSSSSPSALLKFSLSSSLLLSLLWQGRLKNCLVSIGIKADLAASSSPTGSTRRTGGKTSLMGAGGSGGVRSVVRSVGMEIVYWGGGTEADAEDPSPEPGRSDGRGWGGVRIGMDHTRQGNTDSEPSRGQQGEMDQVD